MPLFGPPDIERLEEQRNARGLIRALDYERDATIQREAAVALGRLRSEQALPALLEMAAEQNTHWRLRCAAIEALGQIGSPRAVAPLRDLARQDDAESPCTQACLQALALIGDPGAIEALIEILNEALRAGEDDLRDAAIEALADVGPAALDPLEELYEAGGDGAQAALAALEGMGPPLVEKLIEQVREGGAQERAQAAELLGELRAEQAIPILIYAMGTASMACRHTAASGLEKIGETAVPALAEALQGSNRGVHRMAIETLGQIGGAAAGDALLRVLREGSRAFRREAAKALATCAEASHLEPLMEIYQEGDWATQREIAKALARIGDKRAAEVLVNGLTAPDKPVRESAMRALNRLRWKPEDDTARAAYLANRGAWEDCVALGAAAVPALVHLLPGTAAEEQEQVIQALARLAPEAAQALIAQLQDGDSDARIASARALGVLGDPSALPSLREACHHSSGRVRAAAFQALGQLADPAALPDLMAGLDDANSQARHAAARALGALGEPAVEPLKQRLEEEGPSQVLIEALGYTEHPAAVEPLIEVLKESAEGGIASRCRSALTQIGKPAVPSLTMLLRDQEVPLELRQAALEILARIGEPQALGALVSALWREEETLPDQAAELLAAWQTNSNLPQPPERLAGVYVMLVGQEMATDALQPLAAEILQRLASQSPLYRDLHAVLSTDFSLLHQRLESANAETAHDDLMATFNDWIGCEETPPDLIEVTLPADEERGHVHALVWYKEEER